MEDQKAVSRIKQGDLGGLEPLVRRYQVQAVRAAYLVLYDRSLAEEVVQAAFIKAAQRIEQFDASRPFGPWFFRIVVNDAIKLAKKEQRIVSLDQQLEEPAARLAAWLADPDPPPELQVEQAETRQAIMEAVRSLPPEKRAVIVMRYYLDLRMNEMSDRMDRPLSTIKWWLRDARKRLRDRIEMP